MVFSALWANIEQHTLFYLLDSRSLQSQSSQQQKTMHSVPSKEFNITHQLKSHKSPRRSSEAIAMAAIRLHISIQSKH